MAAIYHAEATSQGGRNGRAQLKEGGLDLAMGLPKEMGGNGQGNNPEQLFAMGYAACFNGALGLVARQQGKKVDGSQVSAVVGIGKDATSFALDVELKVSVPGMPREEVQQLAEAAHQVCPYSNATRGNLDVRLEVA